MQYCLVRTPVRQFSVLANYEKLSGKGSKCDSLATSPPAAGSVSQKMESLQYWLGVALLATLKQEGLVGTLTLFPEMQSLRLTSMICLQKQFSMRLTRFPRLAQLEMQTMLEVLPAICSSWLVLTLLPIPTQKRMIPLALALLAAYSTESYEPPSVRITNILGTPLAQLAFLMVCTDALMASPVAVPPPLQDLDWIMFSMAALLLPQAMQGSQELSKKWMDMMLRSSQVWLTQVQRKVLAYWKADEPMLPDSSTRKLIDWYLLQRVVTESIRQALCRHSGQELLTSRALSSLDMAAQLLKRKFFQKVPPRKFWFMLYLAISTTAVLMLMLRLAQEAAELIRLALQRVDRLATTLFRYPVRRVTLWASVSCRGKTLLTHCALDPVSPRQGLMVLVRVGSEGTQLSSSEQVRFSCTPLPTVRKLAGSSWQPQLKLYSSQGKKEASQSRGESTLDPPFFMFSSRSVTLVPQTQEREADSAQEEQQTVPADETSQIENKTTTALSILIFITKHPITTNQKGQGMGKVSLDMIGWDDHCLGFLMMFHQSATLPEGIVIYWYFS